MTLHLNTADSKLITVSLKQNSEVITSETDKNEFGSEVILPLIMNILEKNHLQFKDLKEIEVETGPGSYTGLKVGAAVAQTLGYILNIPVNGKKDTKIMINYA